MEREGDGLALLSRVAPKGVAVKVEVSVLVIVARAEREGGELRQSGRPAR